MTNTPPQPPRDAAVALLGLGREAATVYERPDLVERLAGARSRLERPDLLIGVVGEFKQGKSSLVNGLLGRTICPVDDDLATSAVTVIRHGAEPGVAVHRVEGGEIRVEAVPADQLPEYVSERGNPDNARRVELVEVSLPHPLLERGYTIVDTPGVGGLHAGYRAATLSFLSTADVALFVTDASAELSGPEAEFLAEVRAACPRVLVVMTKADLYPHWARIFELNQDHLARAGVSGDPFLTSTVLRTIALRRRDRALDDDSGFPDLLEALRDAHTARAGDAIDTALAIVDDTVAEMRTTFAGERDALASPEAAEQARAGADEAQRRLEALRAAGSRWQAALNDGFTELNNRLEYDLRSGLRAVSREADTRLEEIDPGQEWDAIGEEIQERVGGLVSGLFAHVGDSVVEIEQRIAELLAEDGLATGAARDDGTPVDVRALWRSGDLRTPSAAQRAQSTLGTLRGAQGGIMLMGMLANIAGLALVGPVMIGVGAVFGGKALLDQRRQGAEQRRQQARGFVRQFVEEVQFEVSTRVRELTRQEQRRMRDTVTAHVRDAIATHTESARQLRVSLEANEADRRRRAALLTERIGKLDELARRVALVRGQSGVPA